MPPALLPFWLIRVVWCPLAGPVVALCVPRPCVMKMFHAPVERSTVDPSYPVPRSKTAPVKNQKTVQKWCRNGAVLNPTAEMHFTEGSQGNEGTRLSVGNGPDPKSSGRKTPTPSFFVHFVCFCKSASVAPLSRPARSVVADVRGGFSGVSTPPPIHEPPIRKNDFQRLLKTRFMGPMLQLFRWWSSRHVGRTGVLKMAQD